MIVLPWASNPYSEFRALNMLLDKSKTKLFPKVSDLLSELLLISGYRSEADRSIFRPNVEGELSDFGEILQILITTRKYVWARQDVQSLACYLHLLSSGAKESRSSSSEGDANFF